MEELRELLNHISETWTANDGGLTMAAQDELSFGQSLLADWKRGISRDFSREEYSKMSPTSQEMLYSYNRVFMARFMEVIEDSPVVGLPSNCSFEQLESFLLRQDSLIFEFTRKGESVARAYWADDWNAETNSWEAGGCVSCLINLKHLKGLVDEALFNDPSGPSVPVSMIDSFRVNPTGDIDFHCDNGWNFSLGNDNYVYEVGKDA